MADLVYNSFKRDILNGSINLASDTFKIMLVTSTYAPNIDTHTKRSDITDEVVGTGYTAGGATLASLTVAVDNTDDEGVWDAADVAWTTSTITARGAVIYKSRGGASSADELIGYLDFVSDKISTAGTFTITVNAEGLLNLN